MLLKTKKYQNRRKRQYRYH